jgi:hypothetical protein
MDPVGTQVPFFESAVVDEISIEVKMNALNAKLNERREVPSIR